MGQTMVTLTCAYCSEPFSAPMPRLLFGQHSSLPSPQGEPRVDMDVDFRPITLRPVDHADEAESLMVDLGRQLRNLRLELSALQAIITRDYAADQGRAIYRAQNRLTELHGSTDRAEQTREELSRALRASGRL